MVSTFERWQRKPKSCKLGVQLLRHGEVLTLDSVAKRVGLTKPGVVYHFSTKQALSIAVVDYVIDTWQDQLLQQVTPEADAVTKLKAYIRWAITGAIDSGDLAFLTDPHLRAQLTTQWAQRLDPWLGEALNDSYCRAARLIADGTWLNQALGITRFSTTQCNEVLAIAQDLTDHLEQP